MRVSASLRVLCITLIVALPVHAQPCDPEADVQGELESDTEGRPRFASIRNLSSTCQYRVGLASYRVISDGIDHLESQVLFDVRERELSPGEELDLSVNVPDCAFQVDLFYGEHVPSFRAGVRYGTRKIAAALHGMTNLCPEPTCEEARIRDLRAYLNFLPETDPTCGTVINFSPQCAYDVGIAAYEMYDLPPIFNTQRLFDSYLTTSQPQSTVEICADVPVCAYQLDVFHGPVLPVLLNGESYGTRLMAAGNFISPSRLLCADPPVCAIAVSGNGALCGSEVSRFDLLVPEGDAELDFRWATSCAGGVLSDPRGQETSLLVPTPWNVQPLDCGVTVTVRDLSSNLESSCGQPISCVPEELPQLRCTIEGPASPFACGAVESQHPFLLSVSGASGPTTVSWRSSCGDRVGIVNPGVDGVTVDIAAGAEGPACTVEATVVDQETQRTVSCSKELSFKSCIRDCLGVIDGTATFDRCNVCGGNGQSCVPSCETLDLSSQLLALDGAVNAYRAVIDAVSRQLLRGNPRLMLRRFVRKTRDSARRLYLDAWTTIWSISRVQVQCELSPFCVVVSNAQLTSTYIEKAQSLEELARQAARRLSVDARRRATRRIEALSKLIESEIAVIPPQQSVCP